MKNLIPIFLLFFLSFVANAQTIRRVNATPGITGVNVYTTVQAAHDASTAGDIIYIEPTNAVNTNYGSVIVDRRITLIGTGYDPTLVTGSSFDKRTVSLSSINLNRGSAMSRITGLQMGTITIKDANCIIERNKINAALYLSYETFEGVTTSGSNTIIRNNKITTISGVGNESSVGIANAITSNNLISSNIIYGPVIYLVSSTITRNTFFTNIYDYVFHDVDGSSITANIIDSRDAETFLAIRDNCQGTTASNNLCIRHAGLPANNGNLNSVSSATVFKVANPWTANPFLESNLELSATSPALTVGPGSTPIGAFSGASPFVPSGLTNIPFITDFSINGIGNVNSPLIINVKARSNN